MPNKSKTHSLFLMAGLLLSLALSSSPALCADVAGIQIEEKTRLGAQELLLNGAGLRSKLFFKVYVAALYLPQKNSNAAAIIQAQFPRRMNLRMMRDVEGDALLTALKEGLHDNHTEAELSALQPGIAQLEKIFQSVGLAREADLIQIDFTGEGLSVTVNGRLRGKVADEALARGLMKVWLGDKPVEASLKKALLGQ